MKQDLQQTLKLDFPSMGLGSLTARLQRGKQQIPLIVVKHTK